MPKVRITAREVVHHRETHDISDEDWQKYQRMVDELNSHDREYTRAFEHLLRLDSGNGDISDLEMELIGQPATAP